MEENNSLISLDKMLSFADHIEVPEIPANTNFWLIRTDRGIFYDEYINNEYVALGWNHLHSDKIKQGNKSKESKKDLYETIEGLYNTKRPGTIFNKCDRFINSVKENDIFMIPDKSNENLTFAFAGPYYEEKNPKISEAEFRALKSNEASDLFKDKGSPYVKRRSIRKIKTVSKEDIRVTLFQALNSYHGINTINDYADAILSTIYPIYVYKDNTSVVFRIKATDDIGARPYAKFVYNLTEYVSAFVDEEDMTIKTNVNSAGDYLLKIANLTHDQFKKKGFFIFMIWLSLAGGEVEGKLGSFKVNSLISLANESLNAKVDRDLSNATIDNINMDTKLKEKFIENSEADINLKVTQAENNEADIDLKRAQTREILEKLKNEDLQKNLEEIVSTVDDLKIDKTDIQTIIDRHKIK